MIGSACFAIGAVPGYAGAVGVTADGVMFFAGSLFFTVAAFGSACFLIASGLALTVFGHRWYSWRHRNRPWWIAVANMTGSVAFGVSAVASQVVPDSGAVRNAAVVDLGTFPGAVCFLLGAYLLRPRRPGQQARAGPPGQSG